MTSFTRYIGIDYSGAETPTAGETLDEHQRDAYTISHWLQETDLAGNLAQFFQPSLTENERAIADLEGWILGVR